MIDFDVTFREDKIYEVATRVADVFQRVPAFTLWLTGPLGAGKTTMVRAILHEMGLGRAEAVVSPTFSYVNEYLIQNRAFAHLDLYRAPENLWGDEFLDVGANYRGIFIEWPERLAKNSSLEPTHFAFLNFVEGGSDHARSFKFSVASSPSARSFDPSTS